MADQLVELQEDVRKKERQAIFGRIAVGLVHDLSHPIQNIGNSCKLIVKMFDDLEYRETFKRTVERELATVKRVLDDLRNVARPLPLERFPHRREPLGARRRRVDARARPTRRACRSTASSAPEPVVHRRRPVRARPRLPQPDHQRDSGDGPGRHRQRRDGAGRTGPPRSRSPTPAAASQPNGSAAIFDDFVTTKRRGLGLGLAISKKIVEQLGGTIAVPERTREGHHLHDPLSDQSSHARTAPATKRRPPARVA